MAVKASAEVTLYDQTDASALIQWYYASTSATPPSKPTTTSASTTPSGWSKSEPTISSDSDLSNYVYACLQLVWGDGTCSWGDVSLSASFEAAKRAWNKAVASGKTASEYIQTDIDGNGITVHPSRSDYATNGGRAVINADGLTIYLGSDDVASYGASARIGKSNSSRVTVDATNGITIYKGNVKKLQTTTNGIDVYGSDGTTSVASFGTTARLGSISSGNYLVMDSNGLNLYNELDGTNYSSRIGPSTVSLLGGNFYIQSVINGGTASTFFDTSLTQFYDTNHYTGTILTLRVAKDKNSNSTYRSIMTNSRLEVTGTIDATSSVTGTYQVVASGDLNSIALRANTTGNRGLYDIDNDKWIIYKNTSENRIAFNDPIHLYSNTCTINSTNASVYGSVNYCRHNYAVATITLCVNLKASLANGSTVDVATAPANYRPPVAVMGSVYVTNQNVNLQAQLFSGGTIRVNNRSGSAVTTSANIYMSFTFTPA